MPVFNADPDVCECCGLAPAGHGHFALYCEPCSEQGSNCTHTTTNRKA